METPQNCPRSRKMTVSNFFVKIFVFTLLIWTLCGSNRDNIGEGYSYESKHGKALHVGHGRILTEVAGSGIHFDYHNKSVNLSNSVDNGKTGIGNEASSGSTYQPMDEQVAEGAKHLRSTINNVNDTKSKSNKTKRDDMPLTPLFFAKLLLNEPEKGLDIIMLYAGGFLKYGRNRCC
ncbi:hypothetical protein AK88_02725 [Plasmodium fragile]|uniref:Uncharacterized protein n=1 Tax=Plasmodium fragile TaxID=5857 RepID=A0A0D9QKJ5_PLAFR|nr:uncharacterized protein AK88_02725 [Plasmodium fragile]KJP87559.1 hypothetical protein AK88_02725 [Plasmodium fragile]